MKWWIWLCISATIGAEVIELPHFAQLSSYVDEDTLLLVDIDDTLLIPQHMLGCDEWFQRRLKEHQQRWDDPHIALECAVAEFDAIRHLSQMEIVETHSPAVLDQLQKKNICLMGFTTQGVGLATRTAQQLQSQGIDLSMTAPPSRGHYFLVGGHGVLYRNGILFTSGVHKGLAFFRFCEELSLTPSRVVFINDKASHLAEVEREVEKRGIPFLGLRYSYSDARKQCFRYDVASYQFEHSSFERILPDSEVLQQLEEKSP